MSMTSSRPYLIRAIYEWINDNKLTPYLLADVNHQGVIVPEQFATNGRIILNIGPLAAKNLSLGNDSVNFLARFNGEPKDIQIPCDAVMAIYAKENGRGMIFQSDSVSTDLPDNSQEEIVIPSEEELNIKNKAPHLRIVK